MKEKNYHNLRQAISKLPEFSLNDEYLWFEISERISRQSAISNRLTEFNPPADLWNKVEKGLKRKPDSEKPVFLRYFPKIAAAAAILIILGIGWRFIRQARIKPADRYESISEIPSIESDEEAVQTVLFNPAMCRNNPGICSTPLFKELDKQWQEVKGEIVLLESEMPNDDPQFTRYFYRLDELRIEIEKKMIKLILES